MYIFFFYKINFTLHYYYYILAAMLDAILEITTFPRSK